MCVVLLNGFAVCLAVFIILGRQVAQLVECQTSIPTVGWDWEHTGVI